LLRKQVGLGGHLGLQILLKGALKGVLALRWSILFGIQETLWAYPWSFQLGQLGLGPSLSGQETPFWNRGKLGHFTVS